MYISNSNFVESDITGFLTKVVHEDNYIVYNCFWKKYSLLFKYFGKELRHRVCSIRYFDITYIQVYTFLFSKTILLRIENVFWLASVVVARNL